MLSSAFLQSFHYCSFSLVERTINLVILSSNFQGFTLVPWQKVGRICSKCLLYISQILFFPLPVNERYGTEAKISNFSSLIWFPNTLFFIQAFQNATFGVKSTALSQKLSKLAIFHLTYLPIPWTCKFQLFFFAFDIEYRKFFLGLVNSKAQF